MEMLSVKEISGKWELSVRTIQNLCRAGRIPGAVRFGRSWMIPADAEKPKDGRRKENKEKLKNEPRIVMPVQSPLMIMSGFYRKPGDVEDCVRSLETTPETAALFEGEIALIQGDVEKALELVLPLLQVEADFYGTLNVGMITMALANWKNDRELWKIGREHIFNVRCVNEAECKARDLWLDITDSVMSGEVQKLNDSLWTEFDELAKDSVPMYLFYNAKHMHRIGVEVARGKVTVPDIQGMGIIRMFPYLAEPLIGQVHSIGAVLPEIYLHFLCADAYDKIGLKEKSEQHLDIAVSLSLPDKLYGVLAEYRGLMSTALDECLKRKDPEAVKTVRLLEKEMYENWMEMLGYSSDSGLSDRQKEIARLASIGLSNEEIAKHLQISRYTVKSTISMIMNKTGTTKRSEFASYIY